MSRHHQEEASLKLDESGLQKRNLYTKEWWMNPEGRCISLLYRKLKWITPLSPITKFEIKKAIFDINDKKRYKAQLATDGTGITVTEPVQVGWVRSKPVKVQELIAY
jgi:hypothetical protein